MIPELQKAALNYSHLIVPPVEFPYRVKFIALNETQVEAEEYKTGCHSLEQAMDISQRLPGSTVEPSIEEEKRQVVEKAMKYGARWLAEVLREHFAGRNDYLMITLSELADLADTEFLEKVTLPNIQVGVGGVPRPTFFEA